MKHPSYNILLCKDRKCLFSSLYFFTHRLFHTKWRNCKIIPYEWMDLDDESRSGVLECSMESTSYGPNYIVTDKAKKASVNLPAICYRVFQDARVSASSSSVILRDEKILIERSGRGECNSHDYSCGHLRWHGQQNAVIKFKKKHTRKIDKGIFFGGNGSSNYYHWLIEIITKFSYLDSLPDEFQYYPLLIAMDAKRIHSFSEILDKVKNHRTIIFLDHKMSYIIQEVVFIDSPNILPHNLQQESRKFCVRDFYLRKNSVKYLRKIYLEPFTFLKTWGHGSPKMIFLARKDNRRGYNQEQVQQALENYGFVSYYMEDLPFFQQVEIFNNADWIVGPSGAAWTNLVFAQSSAKCLCWMAQGYGDFSAFSNLAKAVGADLRYLTYQTETESTHECYSQSYSLDIPALLNALKSQGFKIEYTP